MTTTQPEHPVPFLDSEGTSIEIGDKVHYVPDEERTAIHPWTSKRSGIVLDVGRNSLGHESIFVHEAGDLHRLEGRWVRDEFVCGPDRLKVIAKANYDLAEYRKQVLTEAIDAAVGKYEKTMQSHPEVATYNQGITDSRLAILDLMEGEPSVITPARVSSELNALLDEAVNLMNLPRDVALGRILDRESGRGGLQRAVHAISRTMLALGVKEKI